MDPSKSWVGQICVSMSARVAVPVRGEVWHFPDTEVQEVKVKQ